MFYSIELRNGAIGSDDDGQLMIFSTYREAVKYVDKYVASDEDVRICEVKIYGAGR